MYNNIVASKLFTYFTTRMGMIEYKRGWLKGDCPECGKEFKYGVQIDDNRSNCFSCGYNAKPLSVIYQYENFKEFRQVYQLLKDLDTLKTFNVSRPDIPREKITLYLPDDFRLIGLSNTITEKIVRKNLRARGFKIRALQRKGVGYCIKGQYKGRIIFPYYSDGKLIYFNARKFIDVGPKFKNPTEEEAGIGKTRLIYNQDALYIYKKIYIFESVTNSLTMGDPATGTGGKSLSNWQINEYIKSPCEEIVIGLDPDAMKQAYKLGMALANYKKVKVLEFPEGEDANSIGRKATKELEKNTPFLSYKELYKKYLNAK